ncbi:MAG: cytochrome c oxidase subunit 3 [Acidimicrobiales bacterium]
MASNGAIAATLAPPPPPARPRVMVVGSTLAAAASVMFFMGLVGIYLALRADSLTQGESWLPDDAVISLVPANMLMLTMLISTVPALWAVQALGRGDRQHAYLALGVTLLLAVAFINQSTYLLATSGLTVSTTSGLLIFAIVGGHLVMTVVGLLFFAVAAFRALSGQYRRIADGPAAATVYWFATVAVFAVIWYAVYVTK